MLNRYKLKKKSLIKKRIIIFPIILFLGFLFIISSDMGIFRWYQLKNQRNQIQNDINDIMIKEEKLNKELDKLLNDTEYIKKIAQEKFHMIKSDEKIFRIIDRRKIK